MSIDDSSRGIDRRTLLPALAAASSLSGIALPAWKPAQAAEIGDPLSSWNDGAAKKAILDFIGTTTDPASASPPAIRTARCGSSIRSTRNCGLSPRPRASPGQGEARTGEGRTVQDRSDRRLRENRQALRAFEEIAVATLTGMDVETFQAEVKAWIAEARDHRWKRFFGAQTTP
jgi:hypothetical protein